MALAVCQKLTRSELSPIRYYWFEDGVFAGVEARMARTGYTGEWGYEVYLAHAAAPDAFSQLLEQSSAKPIGLGARDTLRLEAGYLLYGNDMDETVSPIEAGIAWAVRFDKGDFLGRTIMEAQKLGQKPCRKMVAFLMEDEGIARHGMEIFKDGRKIGVVTSGSFLPTLEKSGGMALIDKDAAGLDALIEVDIRGKRKLAKVVKRPLYSPKVK